MTDFYPGDAEQVRDAVLEAVQAGRKLEIRGGGSKAPIGAPREADILHMGGLAGVVDYDPAELVLTVRAGTPLATVEALVASERQMLAFEPFDHGPLLGGMTGKATIGGVVAAAVAGSRRVTAGSARDHLLGFTAISGRGELFVAGGKVVKNVTGYDLPKLMAGSWGRLAAMTELTLKVLPRPRMTASLVAEGLACRDAHTAMARALGSHADVSAAAHLPAGRSGQPAMTLFRVAGFEPSVVARCALLPELLRDACTLRVLDESTAEPLWHAAMTGTMLEGPLLWRMHLPPAKAPDVIARLEPLGADWALDWGGGLAWIAIGEDVSANAVRDLAQQMGGEAMLVRAPEAMRAMIPAEHPRPARVAALEERVRRAFDPAGVFETGRFPGARDAD